jgi:hypothetical protein
LKDYILKNYIIKKIKLLEGEIEKKIIKKNPKKISWINSGQLAKPAMKIVKSS